MPNVHVGSPRNEWESWESHLIHFHHFESMSTEKDHVVVLPVFSCCNYEWRVLMYLGGNKESRDGMMGFRLRHCSGPDISAKFAFLIRDTSGNFSRQRC